MDEKKSLPMERRPRIRYWLPMACVCEEDLLTELRELKKRGFGGVEIVALGSIPENLKKGKDGWGTEKWHHMLEVIDRECAALGMGMDIANGPGWPIAAPAVSSADHPASLYELTYGVMEIQSEAAGSWELPKRRVMHDEGTPVLLQVMAYDEIMSGILRQDSYLDLTEKVENGKLYYHFPKAAGVWKLFAFYGQPACQKTDGYYVIDHLAREGVAACQDYWEETLKKYSLEHMESLFCDSLEYQVSLDWSRDFPQEFQKRRGYSVLKYLPLLGLTNLYPSCDVPGYQFEDPRISRMINQDYLETLTQCYCENHLQKLVEMGEKIGFNVRYQVAYNKPFEEERAAYYVSIPENEGLGRAAMDGLRVMAAGAHLGRKERYSFECAAEFGNSYGQDFEDLFWWVKRSLMAGTNAQVLHGGSYSGHYDGELAVHHQIPGVQWPGYEAFSKVVSNNWNRTLSTEDCRGCLDAITRMNMIFRKKAKVDCAVLRSSYSNDGAGSEHFLYPDNGLLAAEGFSYEFVSEFLLSLPVSEVRDGHLDKDGVGYKCLIIPPAEMISFSLLERIEKLACDGLPVIWVGKKPETAAFYSEWNTEEKRKHWKKTLDRIWELNEICHVRSVETVPGMLAELGVRPEIQLNGEKQFMTACRVDEKNGKKYAAVYHYNCVEYSPENLNPDEIAVSAIFKKGTTKGSYRRPGRASRQKCCVGIKGKGTVWCLEPFSGKRRKLDFIYKAGYMQGSVWLEEDELIILELDKKTENISDGEVECSENTDRSVEETYIPIQWESLSLESFEPASPEETSFLNSKMVPYKEISLADLKPWRKLMPECEHFCGTGRYHAGFFIKDEQITGKTDCRYILKLGNVADTFSVKVNGKESDFPDQVMKRVDITDLILQGKNSLEITVTSNLYNRFFHEGMTDHGVPLPYIPRDYGIWESDDRDIGIHITNL